MSQSYHALAQNSFPEEISYCATYLHHALLNSFQEKETELPHFSCFTPYSLRHKQRLSPHFSQMQQTRPCVLISTDRPKQAKSSFLGGMLTQLHDGQEEPCESCRRIGFTCARVTFPYQKKPGGLQHWRFATKGHLFVKLWFVIHSTIN